MENSNYLKIWWSARIDNPFMFYSWIILIIIPIAIFIFYYKKKSQLKKGHSILPNEVRKTLVADPENEKELENKYGPKPMSTGRIANMDVTDKNRGEKEIIVKLDIEKNTRGKEVKSSKENVIQEKENGNTKIGKINNEEREITSKRVTNTLYIDSNEVRIEVIHSVPETGNTIPKRIGYLPNSAFMQLEPYKYAVVKMPNKNSLIKFPRKGRSDKKGYKEDNFLSYLNKYFKGYCDILNDRHIPTPNGRPYEPDFVLSTERNNKNMFINIEIDEPYEGWMRTPTHCRGDNDLRDDFFIKRGWIVIRFAEIQIHLEPVKCCSLIAKVISSVDDSFKSELLKMPIPNFVNQWDSLQAKKWASEKYREKYLQIPDFGSRSNVITEYEIIESEADTAVEREVPRGKTIKTVIEKTSLATKNKDERDYRIKFDQPDHRYFIDENPDTISVTQLIDKFFPEFDSQYWAPIKASQRGITTDEILAEWEAKRIESANKGTELHVEIENYYNGKNLKPNSTEFQYFLNFKKENTNLKPFRSEWKIFDEDLLVAGTIDMVYKAEDGSLNMFDWKRSEKVVRPEGTIKNDSYQFAFGELCHIGDNSFNRYCLQQNIYKAILESRYKQKISSMNLLVLHESYDRYHHIQIPIMQKEVNYIMKYALITK